MHSARILCNFTYSCGGKNNNSVIQKKKSQMWEWLRLEGNSEDCSVELSCKSSINRVGCPGPCLPGFAHLQGCIIHRFKILLYSAKPTSTWHKFKLKILVSQHFAPLSSKFWQWHSFTTMVWGVSTEEEKEIFLTVATKSIS